MGKGGGGKGSEEVMRRKKEGEQCLTLAHHLVPIHTLAHYVSHLCFQLLCPHNVIHHLWHVLPSGRGLFLCCCSLCRVCRLPLVMGRARGGPGGKVITQ